MDYNTNRIYKVRFPISDNPNYFFDDYQEPGDIFSEPRGASWHYLSWARARDLSLKQKRAVRNIGASSKLDVFHKVSIEEGFAPGARFDVSAPRQNPTQLATRVFQGEKAVADKFASELGHASAALDGVNASLKALASEIADGAAALNPDSLDISVIIPCYNARDHIIPCLESLARQTLSGARFEAIFVDDASSDDTAAIIESYRGRIANLKLIRHETNRRQGAARNTGLKQARGTYVTFLDSDDFLRLDALEVLANSANGIDLIVTQHQWVRYDQPFERPPSNRNNNAGVKRSTADGSLGWWPFGMLIKRSMLNKNKIQFRESVQFEDIDFVIRAARAASKIKINKEALYYYINRDNSTVTSISKEKIADAVEAMRILLEQTSKDAEDIRHAAQTKAKEWLASKFRLIGQLSADDQADYLDFAVEKVRQAGLNDQLAPDFEASVQARIQAEYKKTQKEKSSFKPKNFVYSPWNSGLEERFKNKVVFYCEVDYHIRAAAPIVRELKSRHIDCVIVDASRSKSFSTNRPLKDEEKANFKDLDILEIDVSTKLPFATEGLAYVFMNDVTYTKNLIFENFGFGVPTIGLYEGINDDWNLDRRNLRRPYRSVDYILLPGVYQEAFYKDRQTFITGLPNVRSILANPVTPPKIKRAVINVNFTYKVLEDRRDDYVETAVQACIDAGLDYVISQHPADKGDLSKYNVSHESIYTLLEEGGILISRFSTTILEALAMGRPAIYHNPIGERVPKFHKSLGAYIITSDVPSLARALQQELDALDNPKAVRKSAELFLHFHCNTMSEHQPAVLAADAICQIVAIGPQAPQFKRPAGQRTPLPAPPPAVEACNARKPIVLVQPSVHTALESSFWLDVAKQLKQDGYELIHIAYEDKKFINSGKKLTDTVLFHPPLGKVGAAMSRSGKAPAKPRAQLNAAVSAAKTLAPLTRRDNGTDASSLTLGLKAYCTVIEDLIASVDPAVIITTNHILPNVSLAHEAARACAIPAVIAERSPFGTLWLEQEGLFAKSAIWNEYKNAAATSPEHSKRGQAVRSWLRDNIDGGFREPLRKQNLKISDLPRPVIFLPMDNVSQTAWIDLSHPNNALDYPGFSSPFEAMKEIQAEVARRGGTLVIKPHPTDDHIHAGSIPQGALFYNEDLSHIVSECDAVVTFLTKIAFAAQAASKPVICLAKNPINASGCTYTTAEFGGLSACFDAALSKKDFAKREQRFDAFCGWLDTQFYLPLGDAKTSSAEAAARFIGWLKSKSPGMDAAPSKSAGAVSEWLSRARQNLSLPKLTSKPTPVKKPQGQLEMRAQDGIIARPSRAGGGRAAPAQPSGSPIMDFTPPRPPLKRPWYAPFGDALRTHAPALFPAAQGLRRLIWRLAGAAPVWLAGACAAAAAGLIAFAPGPASSRLALAGALLGAGLLLAVLALLWRLRGHIRALSAENRSLYTEIARIHALGAGREERVERLLDEQAMLEQRLSRMGGERARDARKLDQQIAALKDEIKRSGQGARSGAVKALRAELAALQEAQAQADQALRDQIARAAQDARTQAEEALRAELAALKQAQASAEHTLRDEIARTSQTGHSELEQRLRLEMTALQDAQLRLGKALREESGSRLETLKDEIKAVRQGLEQRLRAEVDEAAGAALKTLGERLDAIQAEGGDAQAALKAELAALSEAMESALGESAKATQAARQDIKNMERSLTEADQALETQLKAAASRIKTVKSQSVSLHMASALRAMRPFWTGGSAVEALKSQAELEHGHELMMAVLADEEKTAPGALSGKTLIEIGTTREDQPGQGSTQKLAMFCALTGMRFISVDMDPDNTKQASKVIPYINPAAQLLTSKGETYLRQHAAPLEYVYLDAFDFDHGNHSEARQARYRKHLGTEINDPECWRMHEDCAETIINRMVEGGVVVLDDTWTDDEGRYAGKGKLAMPLLLGNGFEIIARTRRTYALRKTGA
ncbi:glycosyltransferase [Alkalicaulis satelles]|nr:glycosyltransferase [Alkalicaulis satelles]